MWINKVNFYLCFIFQIAAVCSCSIDERKLYVTLDSNILDDEAEKVYLVSFSQKFIWILYILKNGTSFYNDLGKIEGMALMKERKISNFFRQLIHCFIYTSKFTIFMSLCLFRDNFFSKYINKQYLLPT